MLGAEKITDAYGFAAGHHRSQTDKSGQPYVRHCIRVAFAVKDLGPEYELVGLFHDIVEDTDCTLDQVRAGWGDVVAAGVEAMTVREGEDYLGQYIPRVLSNDHARAVKLADARDNLGRNDEIPDPEKRAQLREKYNRVILLLEKAAGGR